MLWFQGTGLTESRPQHKAWAKIQKIIFGHAWNEPGTVGLPKKILCGSAHHTLSTDPHVKVRWQLKDVTGSSERITRTVPRTSAVKEYFQAACIIDVHDHLRQGGLAMEDAVATNDWCFALSVECVRLMLSSVVAWKTILWLLRTTVPLWRSLLCSC